MRFERLHEEVERVLDEAAFKKEDIVALIPAASKLRLEKKGRETLKAVVDATNAAPINPQHLRDYFAGPQFEADLKEFESGEYYTKEGTSAFWDAKIAPLSRAAAAKIGATPK